MSACDTCAFGKNGAGKEPYNKLRGEFSALAGSPFWCHHTKDGTEYDWRGAGGVAAFLAIPPAERKVCEGWKQRVAELVEQGHFSFEASAKDQAALRLYQKHLGAEAFLRLEEFLAEKDPQLKDEARLRLRDIVRALAP